MDILEFRNFSFSYPNRAEKAVDNVSLRFRRGEFTVLCGPSGSGKSTLLRQLKPAMAPCGTREGEILFEGEPLEHLDQRAQSQRIGFVQQSPENQIVTDKVWHELAFGLESLGFDTPAIRRRVAEIAAFFGMEGWFYRDVAELSGGQKQLLNMASILAMQPSVLILDEPTSRLDPIAASEFLAALGRINRELGTTVLLTEHRLEEALPLAVSAAVMDQGRLLCTGTPRQVGTALRGTGHAMFLAMPAAVRVWAAADSGAPCPVTAREGRDWLAQFAQEHTVTPLPEDTPHTALGEEVLMAKELSFRYDEDRPEIVKDLSLRVRRGEFLALLGGNGTGKTTSLKLLAGLLKPRQGTVERNGGIGFLPQDPQTLFVKKTVREDLRELLDRFPQKERARRVGRVVQLCRLEGLLDRHPYDLSGGEQQRTALAKVLLLEPEILLMDEPTKGLDAEFKELFAEILRALLGRGTAVLMVSHDLEFCAKHAHRCALFFDGCIAAQAPPREFFSGNSFYTTSANRMARNLLPTAVTAEDVMLACGGTLPPAPALPEEEALSLSEKGEEGARPPERTELPLPRRVLAILSGLGAVVLFLQVSGWANLSALFEWARLDILLKTPLRRMTALLVCLFLFALSTARPAQRGARIPKEKRTLSKRSCVAAALVLLLIPVTLLVGQLVLGSRKYYIISMLILLETMLPFFLVFEGRKPQARELVVLAVLCALGVAGRYVFVMLPQFKPVLALTILSGAAFGGETGFLVGSMTMLASNVLFSQGPWTPWQMFAMGLCGFLAGILFQTGWLRRTRAVLCIFGALVSVVIYGCIMNTSSALLSASVFNWKVLASYWAAGFPMDCVQAAATWLFLWFGAGPFLEKLERVKIKYGLME